MTQKTGAVVGAFTLTEEMKNNKSVILISRSGQTVRVPLAGVRVTGRNTQGVILAKLKNSDDAFVSSALAENTGEEPGIGTESETEIEE